MSRYVAFLRGVNVGGRVVVKETLKQAFTSMGFQNVSTFRQSGNVIFESDKENSKAVKEEIEFALKATLGYDVKVFVRTFDQLKSLISLDIYKGQSEEGTSFLVTFLPSSTKFFLPLPLTIPKSTAEIIASVGSEVYSVTHGGGEGALPNLFVESKLKVKATTRNINIINSIIEKYS